ncbi:MAG: hypothetical protein RL336_13 [Pseudomonadota bacterium]
MRTWMVLGVLGVAAMPALAERVYSPQAAAEYPTKLLFGDLHLHTSYSSDAGMIGARLGPDEAYRFARGEKLISNFGSPVQIARPLDFLAVTDHAENLGLAPMVVRSDPELLKSPWGRKVHDAFHSGNQTGAYGMWIAAKNAGIDPLTGFDGVATQAWKDIVTSAEKFNDPGQFTALIGYEWTAAPGGDNLHRNVIFRGSAEQALTTLPFSQFNSEDPEALWTWMQRYQEQSGDRVLAIPHNSNLSVGRMFADTRFDGSPIDVAYARKRQVFEPLYETTQAKGDSETHPLLSPEDEFADFETWDVGGFGATPHNNSMLAAEYTRSAYKRGLQFEQQIGANPFRFGLIGATDSHTALPTASEDNWFGKVALFEPSRREMRFTEKVLGRIPASDGSDNTALSVETSASGLTAVWARENTREGIWNALNNKETYATTGTRIGLRFFAGYDFTPEDVLRSDFAERGYAGGVPMGGTLQAEMAKYPRFIIRAQADSQGAFLDRVQVIKLWVDDSGESHEKIYDVAVAGDRTVDDSGRALAPVGNTVDVASATYSNSIGEAVLMAYWQDPQFNPAEHAMYYVRVLEIPTPRWSTKDAMFYGEPLPENVPSSIQERAYSSPVWVTPL